MKSIEILCDNSTGCTDDFHILPNMVSTIICHTFKYHENDLSVHLAFHFYHVFSFNSLLITSRVVFYTVNMCI